MFIIFRFQNLIILKNSKFSNIKQIQKSSKKEQTGVHIISYSIFCDHQLLDFFYILLLAL